MATSELRITKYKIYELFEAPIYNMHICVDTSAKSIEVMVGPLLIISAQEATNEASSIAIPT